MITHSPHSALAAVSVKSLHSGEKEKHLSQAESSSVFVPTQRLDGENITLIEVFIAIKAADFSPCVFSSTFSLDVVLSQVEEFLQKCRG